MHGDCWRVRTRHPIQDTRDAVCLLAYLDGWNVAELAEKIGRSARTINRWIQRARSNTSPPDLELWMSGAGKACPHSQPIVRGMPVLCLDCLELARTPEEIAASCGLPSHPALRRGAPIGSVSKDSEASPAEIAASVQHHGPAKFQPNIKSPKTGGKSGVMPVTSPKKASGSGS